MLLLKKSLAGIPAFSVILAVMLSLTLFLVPSPVKAAGAFQVSGKISGSYETLADAFAAVNSSGQGSYTITCSADTILDNTLYVGRSAAGYPVEGLDLTLKSSGETPYTISPCDGFIDSSATLLCLCSGCSLTMENVTLEGKNFPNIRGINFAPGSLTLDRGATIQNCTFAVSAYIYVDNEGIGPAGDIIVNDGATITNCLTGLQVHGTCLINGGTFSGNNNVLALSKLGLTTDVAVTINGGVFSGNTTVLRVSHNPYKAVSATVTVKDASFYNNENDIWLQQGGSQRGILIYNGSELIDDETKELSYNILTKEYKSEDGKTLKDSLSTLFLNGTESNKDAVLGSLEADIIDGYFYKGYRINFADLMIGTPVIGDGDTHLTYVYSEDSEDSDTAITPKVPSSGL